MFDWDRDQESTVALPQPQTAAPSQSRPLLPKLGVALLFALIALGVVYEKDIVVPFRAGAALDSALNLAVFAPSGPVSNAATLPDGLVVYDPAQARAFLRGLGSADVAGLMLMSRHLTRDLAYAGPGLAPFYQDAQLLIATELSRRKATVEGVPPTHGF